MWSDGWDLLKERELFVGGFLNVVRKLVIKVPKIARRERFERAHSFSLALSSAIERNTPVRIWLLTFSTR
jgi:hypothetical protein